MTIRLGGPGDGRVMAGINDSQPGFLLGATTAELCRVFSTSTLVPSDNPVPNCR